MKFKVASLVAATLIVAVIGTAAPAGAGKPSLGCPTGWSPGEVTLAQAIALAPDVPVEIIEAGFNFYNRNGDDRVCIKDLPDTPGLPSVVVNMVDNNASTP
jgi:hypothetical protein